MRNYIESLPRSLEEAALIDGANDIQVLVKIVLPLCLPILATLGLFTIVGYWNSYFSAIIYITKRGKWPLQLVLRELLFEFTINEMQTGVAAEELETAPFLQRYFTTGLVLGGVKE